MKFSLWHIVFRYIRGLAALFVEKTVKLSTPLHQILTCPIMAARRDYRKPLKRKGQEQVDIPNGEDESPDKQRHCVQKCCSCLSVACSAPHNPLLRKPSFPHLPNQHSQASLNCAPSARQVEAAWGVSGDAILYIYRGMCVQGKGHCEVDVHMGVHTPTHPRTMIYIHTVLYKIQPKHPQTNFWPRSLVAERSASTSTSPKGRRCNPCRGRISIYF